MGVIWVCDILFGLHGIVWGFYDYIHEFISSWDPLFFGPHLVATRSPKFFQNKAFLLDNKIMLLAII